MTEPLGIGATWLPAASGPHCWLDFRPVAARAELTAMRAAGIATARVHLAWDAFVPSHRQVNRHRLRDLDTLLEAARALGMRCELVLFAQSFGGGLLLPRYAVDRARPRRGVRVVCEGALEAGGPRDQWVDPLMLEVEAMWLEALLGAFANHPAVACWDLGHDPAATLRPRRTAHLAAWAALLGGMVRARQDRARLTLGAGDVLGARGVRLAAVAAHVDEIGLLVDPHHLGMPAVPGGGPDLAGAAFTLELAHRLAAGDAGEPPAVRAVTGVAEGEPADLAAQAEAAELDARLRRARVRASVGLPGPPETAAAAAAAPIDWDTALLGPDEAHRAAGALLARLAEAGAASITATAWTVLADRVAAAAPLDRRPSLARHGLARPDGSLRAGGEPWSALALAEREAAAPLVWPARLDVEQYYAALPDSARDLRAAWEAERGERASGRVP